MEHPKRTDDASGPGACGRPTVEAEESELDHLATDQHALVRDLESLRRSCDTALEDVVQRVKSFEGVLRGLVVERDQLAARIVAMEKAISEQWQTLERGAERTDEAARRLEREMNDLARRGSQRIEEMNELATRGVQRIEEMLDPIRRDLSEQRVLTERGENVREKRPQDAALQWESSSKSHWSRSG